MATQVTLDKVAVARTSARPDGAVMSLSQYLAEHPIDRVFPSTSERAARLTMLIMFALIAATIVVLVLDEVGAFR